MARIWEFVITGESMKSTLFARTHYQRLEERHMAKLFDTRFKGKSVLDIGCGHGKYLRLLHGRCSLVVGVDANSVQVEELRREGHEVFPPEELPERQYDILLMSHVIEHMPPETLLAFMDRYLPMLKDDGRLIVITPLPGMRFWFDFTHIRPYTPQSLGMMFGILDGPAALKLKTRLSLEDIWFFRDSWRCRMNRRYYGDGILLANALLAGLHVASGGRLGALASWLGIYKRA
jgi:SAM-dependent methyltransferase